MSYNTELVAELDCLSNPNYRQHNDELLPLVVAGDGAAREEMICSNVTFARYQADFYIRSRFRQEVRIKFLRDDLVNAGILGIVKAVNRIAEGTPVTNPTAMIAYWIKHEIMRVINIEVNGRQEKESASFGPLTRPLLISPSEIEATEQGDDSAINRHLARIDPSFQLVDLRDLIYSCCRTDRERTLIRLREVEGMDCTEIAPFLGVSRDTVYRMLKRIEQRFNQKNHP
jgi:RNA polymerase sigma factor (sigma-70 family)